MKEWLLFLLLIAVFLSNTCISFAEETSTSNIVEEVGNLFIQATPEEQQKILESIILYMMLSGSDTPLTSGTDITISNEESTSKEAEVSVNTYKYPIIYEDPAVEAYITAWKDDSYQDTISCVFDVTVYNNSDISIEFSVRDLKVNGWNLTSEGSYYCIARLAAGEKVRETWMLYGLNDTTDITSLSEIESIDGLFFVGKGDSWGEEIATQALSITSADLANLPFKN